jgi:hypothetical protein
MEESRIIRSAKQGDPQAIANFLGNHLASFSVWVTAIPNRHYLDLYLESLDPPHPDRVLSPIQQLLAQLQPADVEVVKISGRKYGETRTKWQQTFVLSAVQSSLSQPLGLLDPLDTIGESFDMLAGEDLTELEEDVALAELGKLEEINSLSALVLAAHDELHLLGVAAKIDRLVDTLRIELRSAQVPDRESCLLILDDLLARLNMPDIHWVQVQGYGVKQLTPAWEELIPLADVLLSKQILPGRRFISFKEEEEFWLPLGIGLAAGLLVFVVPLFNFAFSLAVTVIVDLGQALGYGLMGYLPVGFNSPLEGGGVLAAAGRSPLLFGAVYGLWGLSVFFLRRRLLWLLLMVAIALWHGLVYLSSPLTELFINTSGQLTLWILASVLFYCALGGYSCRNRGERSLYMVFSTFFMCYHLELYWQMWQLPAEHSNWLAFAGIAITLLLPFLTYKIYRAQGLRAGLSQG